MAEALGAERFLYRLGLDPLRSVSQKSETDPNDMGESVSRWCIAGVYPLRTGEFA